MPRYRLLGENGADFGLLQVERRAKQAGDEIRRVTGDMFSVTRVVSAMADDDIDGYLIVKRVDVGRTFT